jgi:16S rRNA (cytidine1402-2'-O)-methyltransferase
MNNKFYIVGTPIGNMEDITYRAVRILSEVDLVLCEDTRVTKRLLDKYNIKTPTMSYPADTAKADMQSKRASKMEKIFEMISLGKTIAFVSCAGTPAVSDPGTVLVSDLKTNFPELEIVPIPGPSALTTALSVSGINTAEFIFLGFLPHKKGRETLFKEIAVADRTMVFYESPHRIMKTIASLIKFAPNKKVVIGRELTKIFEQILTGTPVKLEEYFIANPDKVRGEFVVLVSGK